MGVASSCALGLRAGSLWPAYVGTWGMAQREAGASTFACMRMRQAGLKATTEGLACVACFHGRMARLQRLNTLSVAAIV